MNSERIHRLEYMETVVSDLHGRGETSWGSGWDPGSQDNNLWGSTRDRNPNRNVVSYHQFTRPGPQPDPNVGSRRERVDTLEPVQRLGGTRRHRYMLTSTINHDSITTFPPYSLTCVTNLLMNCMSFIGRVDFTSPTTKRNPYESTIFDSYREAPRLLNLVWLKLRL